MLTGFKVLELSQAEQAVQDSACGVINWPGLSFLPPCRAGREHESEGMGQTEQPQPRLGQRGLDKLRALHLSGREEETH